MERVSARSYAIGIFGLRLTFTTHGKSICAGFPLSPDEHLRMAREHLTAADELRRLGVQPTERPDDAY